MKSVLLSVVAAWNVPLPAAQAPATEYVSTYALPGPSMAYPAMNTPQVVYAYPEPVARSAAPASSAEVPGAAAVAALAAGAVLGYSLGSRRSTAALAIEAEDMWWGDKDYPPSRVLGIGRNVPSLFYGVTSGLAFGIGAYCIAQSNLLNILSGSTVNGWYVAGSLLVPYSWGLHVACWIQKKNGL